MNPPLEFDSFYQTYYPKVLRLCLGYTGNYQQAQDLVQETFIKAWENLSKFRADAQVSTWLYRIAVNTCLYHLRKPSSRLTDPLNDRHVEHLTEAPDAVDQQVTLLYTCISKLAETDRLIITLVLDDTPYAEIAQVVGIREGNLRVKIHRIKQQLSDIYQQYERL